jgi:hypothetical protein
MGEIIIKIETVEYLRTIKKEMVNIATGIVGN